MSILQELWSDSTGRIFLITFSSYLLGYMIYGGYLFSFFGRKGGFPFGLADFSIADLVSLLPVAIITLINIISKAFIEIIKGLLVDFLIPLIIGVGFRYISGFRLNLYSFDATLTGSLAVIGLILWLSSYLLSILPVPKVLRVVFFIVEIFGSILFFATVPNQGEPSPIILAPTAQTQQDTNNILYTILIFEIVAVSYAFGGGIAKTAIKSNLLVQISRLTLRQPILNEGMKKITLPSENGEKNPFRELWMVQKNLPIDIAPDVYEWLPTPNRALYLIATFEKFVVIFIPELNSADNHTIMVNRDVILSMEFINKGTSMIPINKV